MAAHEMRDLVDQGIGESKPFQHLLRDSGRVFLMAIEGGIAAGLLLLGFGLAQRQDLRRDDAEVFGDERKRRPERVAASATNSASPGPGLVMAARGGGLRAAISQTRVKPMKWSRRTRRSSRSAARIRSTHKR